MPTATTILVPNSGEMQLTPELLNQLLQLSVQNRQELAHYLWESLDDTPDDPETVSEGWKQEISRRIEEIDSGRITLLDADQSLQRIEEKLREQRP